MPYSISLFQTSHLISVQCFLVEIHCYLRLVKYFNVSFKEILQTKKTKWIQCKLGKKIKWPKERWSWSSRIRQYLMINKGNKKSKRIKEKGTNESHLLRGFAHSIYRLLKIESKIKFCHFPHHLRWVTFRSEPCLVRLKKVEVFEDNQSGQTCCCKSHLNGPTIIPDQYIWF